MIEYKKYLSDTWMSVDNTIEKKNNSFLCGGKVPGLHTQYSMTTP